MLHAVSVNYLPQGWNPQYALAALFQDIARSTAAAEEDLVAGSPQRIGRGDNTGRMPASLSAKCIYNPGHNIVQRRKLARARLPEHDSIAQHGYRGRS